MRRKKGQTAPVEAEEKLAAQTQPILIHPNGLYPDKALTAALRLKESTLATLRGQGRLVPRDISGTVVYLGADVLAYFHSPAINPSAEQAEPPDSSAA